MDKSVSCSACARTFCAPKNLYRHMRKFHPSNNIEFFKANILCPCCHEKYPSTSSLQDHIMKNHKEVNLHFEDLIFYSEEDFLEWKLATEIETLSKFMAKRGQVEIDQDSKTKFFYCHQSGLEKIKSEQTRLGGSNKIGCACPATIAVTELKEGDLLEIKVKYQATHYGHEILNQPPSKGKRSNVTSQMSPGAPKSKISKDTASSFSLSERVSILSDTDSDNINRDYRDKDETMLHKFSCTCPDYAVKNIICKHIHLVATNYNKEDMLIVDKSFHEEPTIIRPVVGGEERSDLEQNRSKAIVFLNNFMRRCNSSNVTSDELKMMIDSFTNLNQKMELEKSNKVSKRKSKQPFKRRIQK